jgi:alcohol dehydrogenase
VCSSDLVPYGYGKGNAAEFAHNASEALKGSFSGNPVEFNEESARNVVFQLT